MPQMAPLYWLYLLFFFLTIFFLFLVMSYFLKPFSKMNSPNSFFYTNTKHWKL
nr:ATPase F0 subunit 8 [Ilyoplax pusilla]